jgi:hypothetical protein
MLSEMKNIATKVWHGFKAFGEKVASVVNFILLLPVYFIGVGLTKILVTFLGIEVLQLKKNKVSSYWKEYNCKTEEKERYKRMF